MKSKVRLSNERRESDIFLGKKLVFVLLVIYIAFLAGICVFFRNPQESVARPGLFRSYRAAWHGSHLFPFAQNIIINILLYTPVGFLLCTSSTKKGIEITKSSKKCFIIKADELDIDPRLVLIICMIMGFLISLSIENMQIIFRRGTYETDDILNNSFGTLLGASWFFVIFNVDIGRRLIWITYLFIIISAVLLLRLAWLINMKL